MVLKGVSIAALASSVLSMPQSQLSSSIEAVVARGSQVNISGFECVDWAFRPFGSSAALDGDSFVPDVCGDYRCQVPGINSTKYPTWRAIELPPRMGVSSPARLVDGFHRSITSASNKDHLDSDSAISTWVRLDKFGSCVSTGSGLSFSGSKCAGIMTAEDVSSFFAEPLTLTLADIAIKPMSQNRYSVRSSLVAEWHELSLHINFTDTNTLNAVVTTREKVVTTLTSNCKDVFTIELHANSVNASLKIFCGSAPARLWNGSGIAHGAFCSQPLGTDCGHGPLTLRGSNSYLKSVQLMSQLVAGNDPLRPGVEMPAYPAVLAGIADEVGYHSSDLGRAQPRAQEGVIDVTAEPFRADSSGKTDSTLAIQAAVDYAREHYSVVYFPEGIYSVSDTIVLRSVPRAMASGHIPGPLVGRGFTDDFLLDGVSSRYVPNFLVGSNAGSGSIIVLRESSPNFTNVNKPAYVLDFYFENAAGLQEPNAQYNAIAMSLVIKIDSGNVGAVGVRLRGAQGSGLEDVTVYVGPGLAGVVGGCGSGGAHHGLRVIGGRYGLDLRQSQPASTITGITLVGQRCAAIVYSGFETLSAVGINITRQKGCNAIMTTEVSGKTFDIAGAPHGVCTLPPMPVGPNYDTDHQPNNAAISGKMCFVDTVIDFDSIGRTFECDADGGPVSFQALRSLFLQNVFLPANGTLASINGTLIPASKFCASSKCTQLKVHRAVYGLDPPIDRSFQLHAAVYIDGARQKSLHLENVSVSVEETPDLVSRHRWPAHMPTFLSQGCINVKSDLSTPAVGDGIADDFLPIQNALDTHTCVYLPRGVYVTSRTLQVHPGRSLIGVARHLTRITSVDAGLKPGRYHSKLKGLFESGQDAVLPVVEILPTGSEFVESSENEEGTVLGFLSISVWNSINTTSALHWHGDNGIYRQVHTNRANRCGSLFRPGCSDSVPINYPLQLVQGVKHFRMYTFYLEDCCHDHVTSVSHGYPGNPAYWTGFLAGPQGPKYRHLKIDQSSEVNFYHLNCEHGTGEAICEFTHSTNLAAYGLKTEGRFVTLWVRDCNNISVFGTGGAGCSASDTVYPEGYSKYPPTLYRVERTPSFQFANLVDQHGMVPLSQYPNISNRPKDMFDESPCPPSITHMLYVDQAGSSKVIQTAAYDRPSLFMYGDPGPE